ncbi:hypothetical protein M422DRAFT_262916 [Sphaerobolus stellatus SS14]|uniref:DUF4112 domain-containing protein n=1 Tax=Sphaerobolus stellatus (strain SS14) TaxID=990650 RepID=A0A0C9TX25_SPHS4|nr:hypothetical protein M422DRAFT_262916 [Sphaerobolus stellatus SS14]
MSTQSQNAARDFKPNFVPVLHRPNNPVEAQRLYDHIRTVAFYLDALSSMVPALDGLPFQIGIEPIIAALLPGFGPFIAVTLGLYMVLLCSLFGIGYDLLMRMLMNLVLDTFAGLLPIIGPLVDVSFKANLANLTILEKYLRTSRWSVITIPPPTRWFQWRWPRGKDSSNPFTKGF